MRGAMHPFMHEKKLVLETIIINCQGLIVMWWEHLPLKLIQEIDKLCVEIALCEAKVPSGSLADSEWVFGEVEKTVDLFVITFKGLNQRTQSQHEGATVMLAREHKGNLCRLPVPQS